MDHGLRGDDIRRNSYAVGLIAAVVVLTLVSHVPAVGSARAESANSSSIEAAAADAVVDDRVEVVGPAVSVMFQSPYRERRLAFEGRLGSAFGSKLFSSSPSLGYLVVLDPSGAVVGSRIVEVSPANDYGMGPLPVTGDYTLVFTAGADPVLGP